MSLSLYNDLIGGVPSELFEDDGRLFRFPCLLIISLASRGGGEHANGSKLLTSTTSNA